MRVKKTHFIILLFFSLSVATLLVFTNPNSLSNPEGLNAVKKWFILLDYNLTDPAVKVADILRYDMAILDPDIHPPLKSLKGEIILIAYVSVGEAETYRSYWEAVKDKPWIVGENPNWDGNYFVDIRNEEWRRIVIDEVISDIVNDGFEGIMMDTLDTAPMLEQTLPDKYGGANKAMINFVKAIHQKYPTLYLISNNGYAILEDIAPYLSAALAEDINMMIDFEKDDYKEVPGKARLYKISVLKKVMNQHKIPVFNIDYVPRGDKRLAKQCIDESRRLGFRPYVAEKHLNSIYDSQ